MTSDSTQATELVEPNMAAREADVAKRLAAANGETSCRHCGELIDQDTWEDHDGHHEDYWYHVETDARRCFDKLEPGEPMAEPDEDYDEYSLSEFGLGVSRKVVLCFYMGRGGPTDWLEIVCDEVKIGRDHCYLEVESVTYHYVWSGHAERVVPQDSPLWTLAEKVAEGQS